MLKIKGNAADNDSEGIGTIFLKYQMLLKRYLTRYIRQPQDIEDIVHETFLRSYAAEINVCIRSPKSYLFKTAKNLALKHLDKSSYRLVDNIGDLNTLEVLVDEISTESRVQSEEQFTIFCRAVITLPLQCRKTFILSKVYGLSHHEVAEQLNVSISTVEKHVSHGLLKCNEYMCNRGVGMTQDDTTRFSGKN